MNEPPGNNINKCSLVMDAYIAELEPFIQDEVMDILVAAQWDLRQSLAQARLIARDVCCHLIQNREDGKADEELIREEAALLEIKK